MTFARSFMMMKKQQQPASRGSAPRPVTGGKDPGHRLRAAIVLMMNLVLILSVGTIPPAWGQDAPREDTQKAQVAQEADKGTLGSPSPPPKTPSKRSGKGLRTLDEINIEGEIAVPQVLFITARERKHYQDFLHRQYLKGSQELCRETQIPTRLGSWLRP